MVPRRFINLVVKDFRVGGSYWLSRLAPEEKLFYPSAAEAAEAQAQARTAMIPFRSTLDLHSPASRFRSSRSADLRLDFMPLYGCCGGEGKIVVADSIGRTVLYDADDVGSIEMLPRLNARKWRSPISLCVAGALYAINRSSSSNFETLVYRDDGTEKEWRWLDLPPPPYLDDPGRQDCTIHSYTLLGDGKTICFSSAPGGFGTYRYDTSRQRWTKAGRWALPFVGRALHVPELHGLSFGFLGSDPHSLCAVDLPSPLKGTAPPKVLHEWRGVGAAGQDWSLMDSSLLYLGANRFCVAKLFGVYRRASGESGERELVDMASILAGVEVLDGEADKATLQMVKHKHRTYIFERCGIEYVL